MSRKPRCPGPNKDQPHCHAKHSHNEDDEPLPPPVRDDGISGSGEELNATLEKIVSQLGMISSTLHVLEQRVTMNEDSTTQVLEYFRDARRRQKESSKQVVYYNPEAIGRSLREERMRRMQE